MASIIIPTYNRSNTLFDSISSVFFQNFKKIEIIIIDDGSYDNSMQKFNQFITNPFSYFININFPFKNTFLKFFHSIKKDSYKVIYDKTTIDDKIKNLNIETKKDITSIITGTTSFISKMNKNKLFLRNFIYIKLKTNKGTAFAKNLGIYFSNFKYIGFLDSDDLFIQDKIEKCVNFLKEKKVYACQSYDIYLKEGKRIELPKSRKKIEGDIFLEQLEKNRISISSLFIHRKIIDKLISIYKNFEFFPENFKVLEDYFFYLNLTYNFKVLIINDKLTVIRQSKKYNNLSHKYKNYEEIRIKSLIRFCLIYIEDLINNKKLFTKIIIEIIKKYLILIKGKIKRDKFLDIFKIQKNILILLEIYNSK